MDSEAKPSSYLFRESTGRHSLKIFYQPEEVHDLDRLLLDASYYMAKANAPVPFSCRK